jgi:hypothetical protein
MAAKPIPSAKKRKRRLIIFASIIVVFAVFRLLLPSIVLHVVNKKLATLDGYIGHVYDIDILLIAGRYTIRDIQVVKTGGKVPVPFFQAQRADLSVEWKALFKGSFVGEIEVDKAELNFVQGPTEQTTQTKAPDNWEEKVDEIMPLRINRFTFTNSEVHYRDFHSKPKVDVKMKEVNIVATNLTNVQDDTNLLPATATASAQFYGGKTTVNVKLNPFSEIPVFDLNAEMKGLNLTDINDFLGAYGNFEVRKGELNVYTEAAAKEGKIRGYVKPIIKDLDVIQGKGNILKVVWEAIVGASAWLFKNHPKDQLATQIEFEGNLKKPNIDVLAVLGETLRNAFIQAIHPKIENTVNISTVNKEEKKGFFKSLFEGKKDSKDNKEKKK